jgi:hypothetical protein
MSLPFVLQVTDPEIIAFYVTNKLDFEKLNRHFFFLLRDTLVHDNNTLCDQIPQLIQKISEFEGNVVENVRQLLKTNTDDLLALLKANGAVETDVQVAEEDWWFGTYDKEEALPA